MTGRYKKNDYIFGTAIGILFPIISALIIFLILQFFAQNNIENYTKIFLLSVVINILLLRYYFITLKYEKTAKAILLVTFILLIAFFLYYFKR